MGSWYRNLASTWPLVFIFLICLSMSFLDNMYFDNDDNDDDDDDNDDDDGDDDDDY